MVILTCMWKNYNSLKFVIVLLNVHEPMWDSYIFFSGFMFYKGHQNNWELNYMLSDISKSFAKCHSKHKMSAFEDIPSRRRRWWVENQMKSAEISWKDILIAVLLFCYIFLYSLRLKTKYIHDIYNIKNKSKIKSLDWNLLI